MKKLSIICVLMSGLVLSGCGTIIGALGFSGTVVETVNVVSVSTSVYDAGAIVLEVKTLSDHAVSVAMNKDCRMIRLLRNKQICLLEAGHTELASYTWNPDNFQADLPIWTID
jgi:hypothetical protein